MPTIPGWSLRALCALVPLAVLAAGCAPPRKPARPAQVRIWDSPIEEAPAPQVEETPPPEAEETPAPGEEEIPPPPPPHEIEETTLPLDETVTTPTTMAVPRPETDPAPPALPARVRITTLGNLQLVQDPRADQLTVTAEASHDQVNVHWRVEGEGKDFVTLAWTQEGPVSQAFLALKRPVPRAWVRDTQVELFAGTGSEGLPEARATVSLVKFRRGGRVAPGASDICVPLHNGVAGRGWSFQPKKVHVHGHQDASRMSRHADDDAKASLLRFHYQAAEDRGEGTYRLRTQVGFRGHAKVAARYDESSWWHNASIGVAAGILASVDNEYVHLQGNTVGVRYGGYPSSITLGGAAGLPSAEAGITVALTLSNQKRMGDQRQSQGLFVVESAGDHAPGSEIRIEKQVRIGAEILLEQNDDDEWHLAAEALISSYFPVSRSPVEICFSPKH